MQQQQKFRFKLNMYNTIKNIYNTFEAIDFVRQKNFRV